jgi:TonB family protein
MRNDMGALLGAAIALAFVTSPGQARQTQAAPAPIQVVGETVHEWQARIGQSLNDHLRYPTFLGTQRQTEGSVRIAFRCSDTGKPEAARIVGRSGSVQLDQSALRAVRGIETLHPLPASIGHGRPMEAWIIFANDEEGLARAKRGLQADADALNRRMRERAPQIASLEPIVIASR